MSPVFLLTLQLLEQEKSRQSQEDKRHRRGLVTDSDPGLRSSFETLTPRARATASAARAAACQVIMTPGGPLPSPAGCPGHHAYHAVAAGGDVSPNSVHCCSIAYIQMMPKIKPAYPVCDVACWGLEGLGLFTCM